MFSGPIPHPQHLNGYDQTTRETIVAMAVREQQHAHDMGEKGLDGAIKKDRLGQIFGLIIAIFGLGAAAWIAQYSAVAASIIGSIDLLGMVAVFAAPRAFEMMLALKAQKAQQEEAAKKKPSRQRKK